MNYIFNKYPQLRLGLSELYEDNSLIVSIVKTGHIYYNTSMEAYECVDNCGTCDGAKCDFCRTKIEYCSTDDSYNERLYINDSLNVFIFNELLKSSGGLPTYLLSKEKIKQFYSHLTKLETLYSNLLLWYYTEYKIR